jgi:uncharacterized protein
MNPVDSSLRLVNSRNNMIDELTLPVSWRAAPRSFVALMGLYESNYIRLSHLMSRIDLRHIDGQWHSVTPTDCELYLKVIERCRYTTNCILTYRFTTEPREYPQMLLRLYHDAHLLEAHPAWGVSQGREERELDQRWTRNVMLNKWLEYCLERGHRFSLATGLAAVP